MDERDDNLLKHKVQQIGQDLFDSEQRIRSVVENVVDGIITINVRGKVTTFNPAAERIFGYAAQEVIGQNVKMLMPEPYHGEHDGYIDNYVRTGQAKVIGIGREAVGRRKDGSTFPMDLTISAFQVGEARYFTGILRDITQRKLAEEQLRQSEERLRELTAHIHQVLWVIDAKEAKVLYVSKGYEQLWGRTCQSLIDDPTSYLDGIHPLDREMMTRENASMLKVGYIDVESRILRPDGSVRWVWIMGYPVTEQGQIVRLVGIVEDITEKKRLETDRDLHMARLQLYVERLPLAYVLFDGDFRIIDWNSSAERIFGYTKEELLGTGPPFEKFVPRSYWQEAEEIRSRIRSGDMQANATNTNLTKDGRTITCNWFNTPLLNGAGQFSGMLSLAEDVTQRKVLESQFLQAQKMEVLGQLSGGIAHDFNNLLAILLSCSQLLGYDSTLSEKSRHLVEDIYKAASRAASLTRELLTFSRQQVINPTALNLNEIVTETVRLLDRVIGSDITVRTHLGAHLSPVRADAGQINQIIMNIAVNARDAMPNGGTLAIATANIELEAANVPQHSNLKAGRYVELTISDTGHGMSETTASHIFEPFFTTKDTGRGTGLGLSTVFGIVRQSGGDVTVQSEMGRGTEFKVLLPEAEIAAASSRDEKPQDALPRGTETVLVVDDDEAMTNLVCRVLEAQGYTVVLARDGEDALLRYERHQRPIHLLLTDVVMPNLGGRRLFERLRAIQPDLKVLFMSGYPDESVIRQGILEGEPHFIEKPFTYAGLTIAVRDALDGPA